MQTGYPSRVPTHLVVRRARVSHSCFECTSLAVSNHWLRLFGVESLIRSSVPRRSSIVNSFSSIDWTCDVLSALLNDARGII